MESFEFSGEEFLRWRKNLLSKGGRRVDLDWLIDIEGGLSWSSLQKTLIDPKRSLKLEQSLEHLASLWLTHLKGQIPLQYLVGRCPWRDFELEVSPAALIPRAETEILVDLVKQRFDSEFHGVWADLGTGSGPLAVALARYFPNSIGHGVDLSEEALSLAHRNLKRLAPKADVKLHFGNWWEPLKPWWGNINLVVSNPPYIPSFVLDELEPIVLKNEPHLSLCGGLDGLNACREIIGGAFQAMSKSGWLMIEHHHDQSEAVLALLDESNFKDIDYETDWGGIKRFALGCHP